MPLFHQLAYRSKMGNTVEIKSHNWVQALMTSFSLPTAFIACSSTLKSSPPPKKNKGASRLVSKLEPR